VLRFRISFRAEGAFCANENHFARRWAVASLEAAFLPPLRLSDIANLATTTD